MSVPRLSGAAQVRYMLQWFEEWSELQRADFVPLLAEKLAQPSGYLNGVLSSMAAVNCHNKPMSLFQCRIKLFNEWYPTWSEEERERLVKGASDSDSEFGRKLQEELVAARAPPTVNGVDGDSADPHPDADASPEETRDRTDTDEVRPTQGDIAQDVQDEIIQENAPENIMPLEIAATS